MIKALLALATLLMTTTAATAADLPSTPTEPGEIACGATVSATKAEVLVAAKEGAASSSPLGFAGQPFVVWHVGGEAPSTKLAVRGAGNAWKAMMIQEAGGVQGAYATAKGAVLIITMHTSGDPGQEYIAAATRDGAHSFQCGVIDFPDGLNKPNWAGEFLSLKGFQGVSGGMGTMLTEVANDEDKSMPFPAYLFSTGNGGATCPARAIPWAPTRSPKGLRAPGMLPGGDYGPLRDGISASLLATMPDSF